MACSPHPATLPGGARSPPVLAGPALGVTSFPPRARNRSRFSALPPFPARPEVQAGGGPRRPAGAGDKAAPAPPCQPSPLIPAVGIPPRPSAQVSPAGKGLDRGSGPGMLRVQRGCSGSLRVPRSVLVPGGLGRGVGALGLWEPPGDARNIQPCLDAGECGSSGTSVAATHRGCRGSWGRIGDGTGGFGVSLGWICLSCSSTETQAHGGLSPGALCQPGGWEGGTGTLAGGVCQNEGDIPVLSFPHGDSSRNCPVPQQPPPSRLISHFQTLNFLIKTCSWSRAGLSSRRWGLWQDTGCLLHPPNPKGKGGSSGGV